MIRISKIIPKTLTWRLILTSVSVLMAVQFIIIVVFVLDMRQNYAENAHRMTLLRVLSTARVLDHNDPKIYHEFIKTRLTRGLFANITSNPIIPNNRNSDYESKIREELQDDSREIFIETDTKFDVNTENLDFKEKESLKGFNYVANKKPDNLFYAPVSPEREPFPQEKPPFRRSQHLPPYHGDSHHHHGPRHPGFMPPPPPHERHYYDVFVNPEAIHHGRRHDVKSRIATIENNNPFDDRVLPKEPPTDSKVSIFGSIKLKSGYYLTFVCYENNMLLPHLSSLTVFSISLATIVGTLLFFLLFTELTRPLKKLMLQAEKLSSDYRTPPLETTGPKEIQDLQHSFNRMQENLANFIDDRTRILASISHDLKTPLTSLRLRTEFLEENEDTIKLRETIDTMTEMVKATLLFARGENNADESREIHLPSLIESICNNYTDAGKNISFEESGAFKHANNFFCSSTDIHRILQNIIDNAFQYGTEVKVKLEEKDDVISIYIADNGPGIPEEKLEEVFAPFMRLDEARNTQSGHVGLGLSIVRNIVLKQGGQIKLRNAVPHGLEAVISYTCHNHG